MATDKVKEDGMKTRVWSYWFPYFTTRHRERL